MDRIYLASQSPRRAELLEQIGYQYEQCNVAIDERVSPGEAPAAYVVRMAKEKRLAALNGLQEMGSLVDGYLLAADTIIALRGQIMGKPTDYLDYCQMMAQFSNASHCVYSAIALYRLEAGEVTAGVESLNENRLDFDYLPPSFIEHYWQSGEPVDKAGGYAIQGMMASYIKRIEGSYSGVMGLPLYELREALEQLGYNHP